MKTSLDKIQSKTALLIAFADKYQPGKRLNCLHAIDDSEKPPGVTFYTDDRAWILETFGVEGWQKQYQRDGWQHVQKLVDGVSVSIYQAYLVQPEPTNKTVNPALLTGREAGIELAKDAVQEVLA